LVSGSQDEDDNHANGLAFASNLALLVSDEKEQSNQTYLHDVKAGEKLINGAREKKTTGIKAELCDI
jgi:hypothetical protein